MTDHPENERCDALGYTVLQMETNRIVDPGV